MKLIKDYPPETQWQTRDGRPVRLLFTDAAGGFPVVGLVNVLAGNREVPMTWTDAGAHEAAGFPERALDLIPAPVKREGWVNVYRGVTINDIATYKMGGTIYSSKAEAVAYGKGSVDSVPIEWTDGEGLP